MSIKTKKYITVIFMMVIISTIFVLPAYAANEQAQNAATWILDGIFWIALVGGILGAATEGMKRNITNAIIILIVTGIICTFCSKPTLISEFGLKAIEIIGI